MENSVITNILTRRSIRKYKQQQIPTEVLNRILDCAVMSPSALNKQPWQVRIIQDEKLLTDVNDTFIRWAKGKQLPGSASRAQEEGFSVFHHAPTLIIVAADKTNHYAPIDCGILAQTIMTAAHSLGIGSCVIGSMAQATDNDKHIKNDVLSIDDDHTVIFGIALGYADETPIVKDRDRSKIRLISYRQ
jgi:nitroreductase